MHSVINNVVSYQLNRLTKKDCSAYSLCFQFSVENIAAGKPSYMNAFPHNHNGILYDAHYANDGLGAGKLKLLEEKKIIWQ